MRVEKEKHKVRIMCIDGSIVIGFVHVDPGLRIIDFVDDQKTRFIAVTNAEFQNIGQVHSFKLVMEMKKKKNTIILNKTSIRWIEEV